MKRIRSQFTLIFCLLAIVPLVVFSLFTYQLESQHLKEDSRAKLTALHENKALLLVAWLQEHLGRARYAADSPLIIGLLQDPSPQNLAAARQRLALFAQRAAADSSRAYERVFVVSAASGRVVASTHPADEGKPADPKLRGLLAGSRKEYVSEAFCPRRPCQPHVYLGMCVAAREGGRPLGALVAEIDLGRTLGQTVLSRKGLGQTGEALLVSGEMAALTGPRHLPRQAFHVRAVSEPARLPAQAGVVETTDYRRVPVVAAYSGIPAVDWGLMVKQDAAELEGPITSLRLLLVAVVGGAAGVAILLATWLAQRLTRPLETLAQAIRRLSRGEQEVSVVAQGPDELVRTAGAFNVMVAKLRALELFRERFASAAGHDLKGNLVPLQGLLGLVLSGRVGELSDKQREALEACQRSTGRQMALVERLVEAIRLHARDVKLDWGEVSVVDVVKENAALFRPLAEEAGVALELDLPPEPVVVRADRERLNRLVQNLLANAIKYNRRGGLVKLAVRAEGPEVEIRIEDTGRGIAPEDQPALFEPFSRVGSRKDGGLGLGLWIVKTIVDLHGWSLDMKSQPGQGSSFRICTAAHS